VTAWCSGCLSVPGLTSNYFNYIAIFPKCTVLLCVEFELRFELQGIARVSRLFCNEDGDAELQICELVT